MLYLKLTRFAILTCCLAVLCATGNAGVQESTVRVAGFNYQVVMKGVGSGFCYKPGYVLTAGHCSNMGSVTRVQDYTGQWHNATVLKTGNPDWAILSVPTLKVPHLPLDYDGTRENESITACGRFPELRVSSGYVRDWMFQNDMQHCTANVYPGYSGGPVVDADGEVVGIISMMTPGGSCLYVPVWAAFAPEQ